MLYYPIPNQDFPHIKTQLNCRRVKETVEIDRPDDEEPGRTTFLLGGDG